MPTSARVDQLRRDPHAIGHATDAALQDTTNAQLASDRSDVNVLSLISESRIARDDETPDILVNGSTAIDGALEGGCSPATSCTRALDVSLGRHFQIWIRRSMFFTLTLPASVKTALTRPSMLSFTIDVIQMPPGSAKASTRTRH
jgi:hypothetical protein